MGVHAFLGGYTVATKDVLPYSKTVGNRARIYGVNTIGLARRGFTPGDDRGHPRAPTACCCRAGSTPREALARLEAEAPLTAEVRALVELHPHARSAA